MYGNHDGSCALMTILLSSCLDCNVMFAEGGERGGRVSIGGKAEDAALYSEQTNKQTSKWTKICLQLRLRKEEEFMLHISALFLPRICFVGLFNPLLEASVRATHNFQKMHPTELHL